MRGMEDLRQRIANSGRVRNTPKKGILDWEEVFVDATFFPAKKGARRSGRPKGERERSAWWWSMARVFLWEAIPTLPRQLRSGSLKRLLAEIRVPKRGPGRPRTRPKRVIGDKAYDSDPARKTFEETRNQPCSLLIGRNHRNVNRQDDRLWDRYRRRYTVERTFSWIGNFRRIVVRYENHINMFVAFFQLACVMVT